MPSTSFYILKSMHDSLIINATSYIFFNIHNQAIIHPLISHSIAQFIFIYFIAEKLLSTVAVATGRVKANFTSK